MKKDSSLGTLRAAAYRKSGCPSGNMRQIVRHELRVKIRIHAEEIRSSRLDDLPKLIEVVEDLALSITTLSGPTSIRRSARA
jgi:hypothetical protein